MNGCQACRICWHAWQLSEHQEKESRRMQAPLRKNPIFLAIAAVVVMAGLAFAWWTISPLFVRTNLAEGQNIAVAPQPTATGMMEKPAEVMATATPEIAMEKPTDTPAAMMEPTPETAMEKPTATTMAETGPKVLATGNFDRKDEVHYANGQAILAQQDDGSTILRLQDLDAANGPDLFVYVTEHPDPASSEELHQGGHNLGSLKATNGSFNYTLDPSIDTSRIKSIVIYCRAFSVIFSTAKLQAP
jgi:hypothetical protein